MSEIASVLGFVHAALEECFWTRVEYSCVLVFRLNGTTFNYKGV